MREKIRKKLILVKITAIAHESPATRFGLLPFFCSSVMSKFVELYFALENKRNDNEKEKRKIKDMK